MSISRGHQMSNIINIWIKERCSGCSKSPKCRPYSEEMLLCILSEINKREGKNPKVREESQMEVIG